MTFSERLKETRISKHFTQKQVYESIGLSPVGYQRYEYGRMPTAAILIQLADFFDVSIDYLVGRTDNPEVNR